ncbi:hypothetical protein NESM_000203300 [Novymonas esmeraldas]|uniref:Uncharacterized protein n=1 Tax=Novymonas esmeraldas TaxID=1808958 RepID=A0AAW0F914_9TRYP
MSAVSSAEMAKRIREGNLKRREEDRKRQQLEQEYMEVVTEQLKEERHRRSPTRFLPSILVCLLFASFPLSERVVDWCLVGVFCAVNTVLACVLTNPSEWVSIATTVLINFFLVRFSAELYDLPQRLAQVPPILLVNYVAVNVLIMAAAYLLYVNPRFLRLARSRGEGQRRQAPAKHKTPNAGEHDALEAFAVQKAEAERLDLLLCLLLLLNVVALIYLDVIPYQLVVQSGLNVFRLLK